MNADETEDTNEGLMRDDDRLSENDMEIEDASAFATQNNVENMVNLIESFDNDDDDEMGSKVIMQEQMNREIEHTNSCSYKAKRVASKKCKQPQIQNNEYLLKIISRANYQGTSTSIIFNF